MDKPTRGKLHMIIGPMFAGKTSELMKRIRRYQLRSLTCVIIKYAKDDRYSSVNVSSHDGKEMQAITALNLMNINDLILNFNVIGIDEAQFFPDLEQFCHKQLKSGKTILVAGLDATFKKTGFNNVLNIIPLADSIDKLTAICMSCGNSASFSKRVGPETELVVIGGTDKYMAVCRECYKIADPPKSSPFCETKTNHFVKFLEINLKTNVTNLLVCNN